MIDELVFHRRRGLAAFESWGHPVDSVVFALALIVPALTPPTEGWTFLYVGLGAASCLVITKDEWVHASSCSSKEHWLHAMLFILHPVLLGATGLLWHRNEGGWLRVGLPLMATLIALYQFVFWVVLEGMLYGKKSATSKQSVLR